MAVTMLDPNTALIIIDLQKGIVGLPVIHPIDQVVERSCALLVKYRQRGLPVVLVNVSSSAPGRTERAQRNEPFPSDWIDLIPELDQQPSDIVVTKRTWGAFASTDLAEQLEARGVTHVVICGVATGIGVESTARQAYELGFNVTLAVDAMTDFSAEAHAHSVHYIFPKLGETGTAQDIIGLLDTKNF